MTGYCKYCDSLTNKIVKKKEIHIIDGKRTVYYWVGCSDCWDLLQKYVG